MGLKIVVFVCGLVSCVFSPEEAGILCNRRIYEMNLKLTGHFRMVLEARMFSCVFLSFFASEKLRGITLGM